MPLRTWRRISRLADLPDPDAFNGSGNPFLSPAFLRALETSGAVGKGTTWEPCHLLFLKDEQPAALLPLYRKYDSRGEYVFDSSRLECRARLFGDFTYLVDSPTSHSSHRLGDGNRT